MSGFPDWNALTREQRIAAIKPLVNEGLSAGNIANQFRNASRNAVIGYCQRHGIALKRAAKKGGPVLHSTKPQDAAVRAKKKDTSKRTEAPAAVVSITPEKKQALPEVAVDFGPISKGRAFEPLPGCSPVRLEDLGARGCHWPVNGLHGNEPIFCGASASTLYCTSHARLAYTPRGQ